MLKLMHCAPQLIGVPPCVQPVSGSRGQLVQVLVRQYACVGLEKLVMSAMLAHVAAARSFTM
jgi:hypothetical protein